MKRIIVLLAFMLISIPVFAQRINVPKKVKDSFTKLYPKAVEVEWSKENETEFEAGFKQDGKGMSVVLDKEGNVKETETALESSGLPVNVMPYINKNYAGCEITETAKIISASGEVKYEVEVTDGKKHKDILFDKNGSPIKKEKKNEKD